MRHLTVQQPQTQCSACPLNSGRVYIKTEVMTDSAPGEAPQADVLFVLDHPSYQDDRHRQPLASDIGRTVRQHIEQHANGLRVAYAHVVRCRPQERAPTQHEVDLCSDHIRADIVSLGVRVVVLMGSVPLMALNPDPRDLTWASGSVMEARRRGTKTKNGVQYMAMPNPGIISIKPTQQGLVMGDVARALDLARGTEDAMGRKGTSVLIDTVPAFEQMVHHILTNLGPEDDVGMDTETRNVNRVGENAVLTWQFAYDNDTGYVVPYDHQQSPWSADVLKNRIRPGLRALFATRAKFGTWVMHNAPFDTDKVQRYLGVYRPAHPVWDTQFGAYTLDENRVQMDFGKQAKKGFGPLSLKTLAPEWLNFFHYQEEADVLEARNAGLIAMLKFEKLVNYGGMDAYVTRRLKGRTLAMAGDYAEKLNRFVLQWFSRAIPMSPMVERNGITVDTRQLQVLGSAESPILLEQQRLTNEFNSLDEVQATNRHILKTDGRTSGMQALFGPPPWMFEFGKKQHLVQLFMNELKIEPLEYGVPKPSYPDGEPSIDRKFFDTYKDDYVAVKLLHEYRGLEKLRTSYVNSISEFLATHPDMQDGRVRASLLWTRTVTNRLSQKDPNNSQLPRGDNDYKKAIKALYRAADGCVLMEADYSQAEIRWWAEMSGDVAYEKNFKLILEMRAELAADPTNKALAERVAIECDVHRQSASLMYRKPVSEVTKLERQAVKSIVFGSIYGQHVATLAQILKISQQQAEELQRNFFKAVPHAAQWLHDIERFAKRHGYVEDAFGRRRHLEMELNSPDQGVAARALRQARNSPIQGSSSNMMILSACNVNDYIVEHQRPYKLENLVHDAQLLEVPLELESIKEACRIVHDKMTAVDHLRRDWGLAMRIPFEVDFKIGLNWGFAKTVGVTPGSTIDDIYENLRKAA